MTDVLMCGENPIGQVSEYTAGETIESDSIAPVESLVSLHAYAKDDLLVYNGELYIATSAIAVGDTITSKIERTSTSSYANPTRMNHIEDGIYANSLAIDNITQETALTVTSPCITDLTKVVATKKGDRVIIAFKEAVITSGVSQYGPIVEGNTRPTYQAFGRGFIDRSGTTIFFDLYANYTESRIRTGTAFQNGDKIYGSLVYFV